MKFSKEEIYIFLKQNVKTVVLALVASVVIISGMLFFYYKGDTTSDTADFQEYSLSAETSSQEDSTQNQTIFIDIKGQVKNPGLYEMTRNDRVNDAIEKAGGLLADADTSSINLSQKLKDQMMIVVSKKGENRPTQSTSARQVSSAASGLETININLATKEELMKIKGVGETKAQAIIDYRENKGEFTKPEDIMKVKGIGKGSFEKMKDQIEV